MKYIKKEYPRLHSLLLDFQRYCEIQETANVSISETFNGIRYSIPPKAFITKNSTPFITSDGKPLMCDANSKSLYTSLYLSDLGIELDTFDNIQSLPINNDMFLIIQNMFSVNAPKKQLLEFLFLKIYSQKVVIKEGHEFIGRLDENYTLDNPSIRFRDDKKYQMFSYIIYHTSTLDTSTLYSPIIKSIAKLMGIHVHFEKVSSL